MQNLFSTQEIAVLEPAAEPKALNLEKAICTNVELEDGTTTQIITMHSPLLNWEALHSGICWGLKANSNVTAFQSNAGFLSNGKFITSIPFERVVITEADRARQLRQYLVK